jgi:hypothetical protein
MTGGVDSGAPPMNIFQSPNPATLWTKDQDVDISEAQLS